MGGAAAFEVRERDVVGFVGEAALAVAVVLFALDAEDAEAFFAAAVAGAFFLAAAGAGLLL
mgnify:CR=1 FL=1